MVTVGKRLANNLFHNSGRAFFIKFFEHVVVFLSINKSDIYRHEVFSYEEIVDPLPVNNTVQELSASVNLNVKNSVFAYSFTIQVQLNHSALEAQSGSIIKLPVKSKRNMMWDFGSCHFDKRGSVQD